jgi:ATP-dependent Clp protease ATP-binding subunit ClpX
MITCDFCGKRQNEVETIITSQRAQICNECVEVCVKVLQEEKEKTEANNKEANHE